MGDTAVIALQDITKAYQVGGESLPILKGIQFVVHLGEMVAIMGPSGSGKSTLMNILGCLDRPTSGQYLLSGRSVGSLGDDDLADVRNRTMGFVFQNYNLLPRLTALQNVELPLIYRGMPGRQRRQLAQEALAAVGLSDRLHHLPTQMSGGQQQRVSVARALVGAPRVLLADEPTGNLDSQSGRGVMALLQHLNDEGMTIVVVTHDDHIAHYCRRMVRVADGQVVADETVTERLDAAAESGAREAASA